MESLHTPALALSMLAAALLTMGLLHIARRESFPGAEHGSLRISGRRMKWVWGIALLTAFIAGGPEILATTEGSEARIVATGERPAAAAEQQSVRSWSIRIASYTHSGSETRNSSGEVNQRTDRTAVRAPVWLPFLLMLYWIVVVRPELRSRRYGLTTERKATLV